MKTTSRNFKLFLLGAILALPFLNKWDSTAKAQANTWAYKTSFPGTGRNYGVGFAVGSMGYAGLGQDGSAAGKDIWEYNPSTNAWTQKADCPGVGRMSAVAFGIGTKGYVGTGQADGGSIQNDFYEFDPVANTWTAKASYPVGVYGGVAFTIGSKGYVGTGQDASTFYTTFYEYDPAGNTWTAKASLPGVGRRYAVAFNIGTKGYAGAGAGPTAPGIYSDFYEYSQVSDTWTVISSPAVPGTVFMLANGFASSTKGYVVGGYNNTGYLDNVSEYDPTTGNWTAKTSLPMTRRSGGSFFIGTKGYLATGNSPSGTGYSTDLLEYSTCAPTISLTQASAFFCSTSLGTVTLQASGADTYTWSNSLTNGSMVTPSVSTVYTVSASSATCPGVTGYTTVNVTIDSPTIAVTASSASICSGSSVTLTSSGSNANLVAYYTFNEGSGTTVADASGNNLNGTLVNSPTWSTSTAPLTAAGSNLSFNPGYVNVPDNTLFNNMQSKFTIEAWIYPTSGSGSTIVDRANYNFLFQANANGQKLGFYNNSGGWSYSSSNVPVNQWSHVAITYDGSTLTFYLNGVSDGTASRSNLTFNSGPMNIGRQEPNSCQCNIFTGKLDEVRLWSSVRTAAQLLSSSTNTLTGWSSYTWSPSGSLSANNTPSVIATPGTSTNYTLSATNSNGCSASTVTSIAVNSAPTLAISGNSVICSGKSTTLTASGSANTYAWNSSGAPVDNISSTALAVGLRKLRTAYTGNAIRLRRSSDNVEQDFGFLANGDLDVASINTFLGGSVGYCTTMYDQSGNSRNVTQTSTGNQPTLTISGINSKPTLHFTNSQYMTNTTNFASPFTAIYTARQTGPTRQRMLGGVSNNWLLGWWGGNKDMAYLNGWVNQSSTPGDNGVYVYTGASDGSISSFYGNGTLIASNNGGTSGPAGIELNGSGGGETSDGDFTEVYVFNAVLSNANRQIVENNTGGYYGAFGSSVVSGSVNVATPTVTSVYTLTGTGANGCSSSITQSIIVNASPTVAANSSYICSGSGAVLTASGATTYSWSNGVANGGGVTPTITTAYIVTGTTGSCSSTAIVTITVKPTPLNQTITAATASVCGGSGSTTINSASSEVGVNYYLRDNSTNSVVTGPIAGTGSGLSFTTGVISSQKTFNVLASKSASALAFASGYVSVPQSSVFNYSTNVDFTYEAWINCTASQPDYSGIVVKAGGGPFTQMVIVGNKIAAEFSGTSLIGVGAGLQGTTTINNGVWHHVAMVVTRSTNNIKLYVDGVVEANVTNSQVSANINDNMATYFGADRNTGNHFNGMIDEVRIWNTAKTQAQLVANANTCYTGTEPNLLAYYQFENGSGSSTVTDLTSNHNNGTLTGMNATTSWTTSGVTNCNCSVQMANTPTVGLSSAVTPTVTNPTICAGASVTIVPSGTGPYTITGGTFTVSPSSTTSYTVTDTGACNGTVVATVSVNTKPTITVNSATICSGNSVVITPTAAGAASFTITGGSFSVSPNATTSYSVTGTGTNGCPASNTAVATVSVNTTPTITLNSATICAGSSVAIAPTGAGAGATYSIQGGNFTVTPGGTTTYSVAGTGSNSCVSNSVASTVSVNIIPSVSITPTPTAICNGFSGTLTAAGATTYSWNTTQTTTSIVVNPTVSTNYTVNGTSNGCTGSATFSLTVNTATVGITGSSTLLCSGQSSTLTASNTGNYLWNNSATSSSIVVSPATTTTYSVTRTSTLTGCSGTAAITVSVNTTPTITVNSATICAGSSATITPTGAGAGATYSIQGGTFTVTPGGTTTYSVAGTSTNGCVSNSVASTVSVNVIPSVSITATPTAICNGFSGTLTAGGATTYSWNTTETTTSIVVNPTVSTNYTVNGTSNGCTGSTTFSLTVNTATVGITGSNTLLCTGQSATLTASNTGNYLWNNSATSNSIVVSPATTTTYSVTRTSTLTGCSGTAAITVSVNTTPTITVNSATICSGASVVIAPTGAGTGATYTIQGGSTTVTPNLTTTYSVAGTSTNGCVSNSVASTVSVNTTPTITVNSATICSGSSVVIAPTGAGTGATYSIQGGSFNVSPTITATYSVASTGTNGCVSQSIAATVSVNTTPTITANNSTICSGNSAIITPAGAGTGATYTVQGGSTTVSPNVTTTYSVVGTSTNGCASGSVIATVSVNTTPTLTANSGAICPGNIYTITPGGNTGGTYTISGGSYTIQPSVTTSYTLTGTGIGNCAASNSAVATVSVVNTLTVSISGPTTVCNGAIATLTANGGSSYTWTPGNITTNTIALSPTVNTTYTVTGVSGSCSNTAVTTLSVLTTPTITANSATICSGASVTIAPTGAGIGATYSIQGGSFMVTPNVTTSYSIAGTATNGCTSNSIATTVSVNTTPTITVNSATICSNSSVTIIPSGAGTGATYTIQGGIATVSPTINTTYSVVGTSTNGCVSGSVVSTVSVNTTPTLSINSGSICSNKQFTIVPSGNAGGTYTITGGTYTVSPLVTTSYSLTGTGAGNCAAFNTVVSTVSVATTPTITVNSATICSGASVVIAPNGAGINGSYTITGGTYTVTPSTTSFYSVTATSSVGCAAFNTVVSTVSVNTTPSITVNSATICSGSSVAIAPAGAGTGATYTIQGGSYTVTPNTTTSYSIAGTATNGCTSNSIAATVSVNATPSLTANSGAICPGNAFTITPGGNAGGTYTITGNNYTVNPASTTSYTLTGTGAGSCAAIQAVATVSVVNTLTVTVSGATTVCNGAVTTLTAGGASNYTWTPGTITTATAALSPTTNTTYTVTGASGTCSNVAVVLLSVLSTPTIVVNSATICSTNSVAILPSGAGTGATYTIQGGTSTVSPTITTTYSVVGTNTNGCVSNSVVSTVSVNTTPTLSVNSATICSGSSVIITPTGSAASYSITGNNFTVTPLATTNYSVTGTNANGCVSSAMVSTITVKTTPTITASNFTICSGKSATVVPTGAGIGATYTIQGGNFKVTPTALTSYSVAGTSTNGCVSGSIAVTVTVNALPTVSVNNGTVCAGSSFTLLGSGASSYNYGGPSVVTPANTTTYAVTGTSSLGCLSSNTATATVVVNALPVLSINASTICSGSAASLSVSGAVTYTWSTSETTTSITVSPTTTTVYSVIATGTNNCVNTGSANVFVNTLPALSVSGSNTSCAGSSVTFSAGGANTYTWNTAATGSTISVAPVISSTYAVTGTDANGCNGTAFYSVTVQALPAMTITGSGQICEGSASFLTVTGADTYSWTTGSTNDAITVTPTLTTTYGVTGINVYGCVNTASQAVAVNLPPTISVISSGSVICIGESATLTASGNASGYVWNTGTASATLMVLPVITTTYAVVGSDANGCHSAAVITQSVSDCTGISKQTTSSLNLQLYPNPNHGQFTLVAPENTSIVVMNAVGQIVHSETITSETTNISISHLANGIYFVKAINGNSQQTVKVIKD